MPIYYQPPEPIQAVRRVLPVTPGSQPPRNAPFGGSAAVLSAVAVAHALAAVPMPTQKPLNVMPLTLKYGSQPTPAGPLTVPELALAVAQWPKDGEPLLPVRLATPLTAPLTIKYGTQPPPSGALSVLELSNILSQWPNDGEPRLPAVLDAPNGAAEGYVPPVVNTPPPRAPRYLLVLASLWDAQSEGFNAGWNVPPVPPSPFTPFARPLYPIELPWWSAQSEEFNASWNVPLVTPAFVPKATQPPQIFDAWFNDPTVIVWVGDGAGLFPTGGDTVLARQFQVMQVAPGWEAQHAVPNAAWNVVPPVVNNPPPRRGPVLMVEAPLWSAQSEEFSASWNVPPPPPSPFTPFLRPPYPVAQPTWSAQSEEFNASWNLPAIVNAFVPRFSPPIRVDSSLWGAQRAGTISPLTLVYGSQPPTVGPISRQRLQSIVRQWPELWWPSQTAGHATLLSKQLLQFVYRAVFNVPLIRVELQAVPLQSNLIQVLPASSLLIPVPAIILRLP